MDILDQKGQFLEERQPGAADLGPDLGPGWASLEQELSIMVSRQDFGLCVAGGDAGHGMNSDGGGMVSVSNFDRRAVHSHALIWNLAPLASLSVLIVSQKWIRLRQSSDER